MAKPSKDKKKSESTVDQPSKPQLSGTSPTSKKEKKKAAGKGGLRTAKRKKAPEPKGMDLSMFKVEYSEGDRKQLVGSAKTQVMGASGRWETELDHKALMKSLKNWMNSSAEMVKKSRGMSKEDWQQFVEEVDFSDPKKLTTKYGPIIAELEFYPSENLQKTRDMLLTLFNEAEARHEEQLAKFLQEHKDLLTPVEKALLGMEEETPKVQDQKAVVKTKTKTKVKAKVKAKARPKPKAKEKVKAKVKTKKG